MRLTSEDIWWDGEQLAHGGIETESTRGKHEVSTIAQDLVSHRPVPIDDGSVNRRGAFHERIQHHITRDIR